MSTQSSNIERRARRLAAQNCDKKVTPRNVGQDDAGRFLVASLAASLESDAGVRIPNFPLTAKQTLENLNGMVEVPDKDWKNRFLEVHVPHHGIVFMGIVAAKNEAIRETNQIIGAGWTEGVGSAFASARARVRAGQILVDFFHYRERKEGRDGKPMTQDLFLSAGYVAQALVEDRCIAQAEEQEAPLHSFRVSENSQLSYDEILENLGGVVEISAFEGALVYRYHVPRPGSVHNVVCELKKLAEAVISGNKPDIGDTDDPFGRYRKYWLERLSGMSESELNLCTYSCGDIIFELKEMETLNGSHGTETVSTDSTEAEPVKAVDAPVGRNLKAFGVVEVSGPVTETDPEQQAEDEARAAEIDAEMNGTSVKDSEDKPEATPVNGKTKKRPCKATTAA